MIAFNGEWTGSSSSSETCFDANEFWRRRIVAGRIVAEVILAEVILANSRLVREITDVDCERDLHWRKDTGN